MAAGGRSTRATVAAMAAFVAALVLLGMPRCIRADITCDQVISTLRPCRFYLATGWGGPSSSCCNGVRSLAAAGRTTQDRQTICSCVKSEAAGYSSGIQNRAAGVPAKCGVSLSYQISPGTDCNSIS